MFKNHCSGMNSGLHVENMFVYSIMARALSYWYITLPLLPSVVPGTSWVLINMFCIKEGITV